MPSSAIPNSANKAVSQTVCNVVWQERDAYRFRIAITKDEEGVFSAVVLNLPGIGSCGNTELETMENVKEAIRGALEEYESSGGSIPWKDESSIEIPIGAKQKWIILDA